MATNYANGALIFKDQAGNIVRVNGLSDNDITKLKAALTQVEANKSAIESMQSEMVENLAEHRELAYKDYTQTANQTDMKVGVYYMVPQNAANEFLEFDPATGKPKADQTATDKVVDHYVVMYKPAEGEVQTVGTMHLNFDPADYYNKTEVDTSLAAKLSLEIKDAKPEEGAMTANVVYAFPAEDNLTA